MAIFTARDSQTIGTVTGGEKQTFEVNINVVAGDYIGICRSGGALYTTSAGDGIWTAGGDQTEGVEVTFNLTQNMTASLYGTGTSIDIGSPAIVRPDILGGGLTTIILKDNPANATGIITSIEIYTRDDISSVRVATFFKGEPPPSVIVTTLAPTLVEDGIANLRLELVDKDGAQINPVGWYCDENAAPTTEYEEIRWRAGIGGIDLGLGIYNRYIKTLPTGHSTLYVQAWADDSSNNRYTGSILSFDIPQEAEYIQLPDITFPEFSFPEFEWNWDWSFPDFYWDLPELISPDFPPYPEWQWWMWLPDLPEWEYPEWEWQYPPTWQWWLWLPDLPEWQYPDYPSQSWTGDICLKRTYSTKDVEELRQKCINYENNYIDYCINNNHNIELIKNFLQTIPINSLKPLLLYIVTLSKNILPSTVSILSVILTLILLHYFMMHLSNYNVSKNTNISSPLLIIMNKIKREVGLFVQAYWVIED